VTAVSKISLAYDSLRELLEALSISSGYKIYNHDCYTSFLKEVLGKFSLGDEFDELRQIRNSLNYYGESILLEETIKVLDRIKALRRSVRDLLEKK
jgi:hypothetical protein